MEEIKKMVLTTIIILSFMFLCILMIGCKTIEYVPVESVRVETEYKDKFHRDSIHVFDSVYIREKGDTVWLTRWRTEYKDRLIRDSIFIRDSISIEVPYQVERVLTKWEKTKMDIGGLAIGGIVAVITAVVVWLIVWIRKKFR